MNSAMIFLMVVISTFLNGFSQDIFEPYRKAVDSSNAEKYFQQAEYMALQNNHVLNIYRDMAEMVVFCDLNGDSCIDLFVADAIMGQKFYYFFPGISSDSIGEMTYVPGEILNIHHVKGEAGPALSVLSRPCCLGIHDYYYHFKSFQGRNGYMIVADTIITDFLDYRHNCPVSHNFHQAVLTQDSLILAMSDDSLVHEPAWPEMYVPLEYFSKGQKILLPQCNQAARNDGYVMVLVPKEPSEERLLPDGSYSWQVEFGWIKRDCISE